MLDDKKIKEAENRVRGYLRDGIIETKAPPKFVQFFLDNAENSLVSAKGLLSLTKNKKFQELTGTEGLKGSLWVINASYYSMFYAVRALLANSGIKLRSGQSIHLLTFDALIHFFYQSQKLEKNFCEIFAEAQEEAYELLGKKKADDLVEEYFWEKRKRGIFTYETGEIAMLSKAETSFERAKRFNAEIRAILER